MKVAILTQHLGHNYGGLLQAYALQNYLKILGCEVETLDRRAANSGRFSVKRHVLNLIRLMLGKIKSLPTESRQAFVLSDLADFRNRRLVMSPRLVSDQEVRDYCRDRDFDVYLVGSDQVWRPRYSPSILNFYLDFLDPIKSPAKRITYAASFGVDHWEYPVELTEKCKVLAQKFHAVSVRESSAVELCKENLGVTAQCVVDPTLLLDPTFYKSLITECDENLNTGCVLSYILDPAIEKRSIADRVSKSIGAKVFSIKPEYSITQVRRKHLGGCRLPGVENWLQAFYDASFVITDSFHGTVFAILFNKPFIAIGNSERGFARFESLLSQFGLLERLVDVPTNLSYQLANKPIDWDAVNSKREALADAGRQFLKTHFSGS